MPLWSFSHTKDLFSVEEKSRLAQQITKLYTGFGLPPFYINVQFHDLEPSDFYIGGESRSRFTILSILHIARSFESSEQKAGFLNMVNAILEPIFEPKDMDWEYFVQETPRDLWRVRGLVAPPSGSEEEKEWARLNKAVKWEEGRAQL